MARKSQLRAPTFYLACKAICKSDLQSEPCSPAKQCVGLASTCKWSSERHLQRSHGAFRQRDGLVDRSNEQRPRRHPETSLGFPEHPAFSRLLPFPVGDLSAQAAPCVIQPRRKAPVTSRRSHLLQVGLATLAPVVCLWAATQWAAAMLSFQAALGPAWIDAAWAQNLCALAAVRPGGSPSTPRRHDVFAAPAPLPRSAASPPPPSPSGEPPGGPAVSNLPRPTARPAGRTFADLRRHELFGDAGVVLGLYDGRYLRHDGPEHVLVVAPTRSGKGVGLVLPTLLTLEPVRRHPRHQGRELGAHRRLALPLLALPAVRSHRSALRPLQSAAGSAQGRPRSARCAEHRRHPGRSGRRARAPRSLGEDRARPADRRHPARAVRRGGKDAGPRRHLPRRPVALDPAHPEDHAHHQSRRHRRSANGAPGRRLDRPRAAQQVRQRALRRGLDGHELPRPLSRSR